MGFLIMGAIGYFIKLSKYSSLPLPSPASAPCNHGEVEDIVQGQLMILIPTRRGVRILISFLLSTHPSQQRVSRVVGTQFCSQAAR